MDDIFTYRLMLLTHGPDRTLTRTLSSFQEHVRPEPDEWCFYADGPEGRKSALDWERRQNLEIWSSINASWKNLGFCESTAAAWHVASRPGVNFVFWLEHDFEFTQDVNLYDVMLELRESPRIFQMAMMRDAVNEAEKAAGGLFESRPEEYSQILLPRPWLEHTAYLTTNPSLMRRETMEAWPWPDYDRECEGKFGLDLVANGYSFGVMGKGEPWVKHIGQRTGFGY